MRRIIFSLLVIIAVIIIANYYYKQNVTDVAELPVNNNGQGFLNNNQEKSMVNIDGGLYDLIGQNIGVVLNLFGQPGRIDKTEYDYDWWVYNESLNHYFQIGVENERVVTVFSMGEDINILPFKIGQSLEEFKATARLSESVSLDVNGNSYMFELTKDELETTPLIPYNHVWAQVYIDKFSSRISSVRFVDGTTLVKLRPYEFLYRGDLISADVVSSEKLKEVEKGKSLQILDMTNIIRERNGLNEVAWHQETANVAYNHSKDMSDENYFSHRSPSYGGLSDRLIKGGVNFKIAGENIAAEYSDAISTVEGWQNSEGHRTTLMNKDFTHLGVGVFKKYYTQNFIQQ